MRALQAPSKDLAAIVAYDCCNRGNVGGRKNKTAAPGRKPPAEVPMRVLPTRILPTRIQGLMIGAAAAAVLASTPVRAQDYFFPVCLHVFGSEGRYECAYNSLAQCNKFASGRWAQCEYNRYVANAAETYAGPYRPARRYYSYDPYRNAYFFDPYQEHRYDPHPNQHAAERESAGSQQQTGAGD